MTWVHITRHASRQAWDRARLDEEVLADIVRDASLHVVLHRQVADKPFKIRRLRISEHRMVVHKLFFNWGMRYWFVALQDEKSGRVITVQPVHFNPHQERAKPALLTLALARTVPQLTYQGGR